jgi:hypothetical protein
MIENREDGLYIVSLAVIVTSERIILVVGE